VPHSYFIATKGVGQVVSFAADEGHLCASNAGPGNPILSPAPKSKYHFFMF